MPATHLPLCLPWCSSKRKGCQASEKALLGEKTNSRGLVEQVSSAHKIEGDHCRSPELGVMCCERKRSWKNLLDIIKASKWLMKTDQFFF